VAAIISGKPEDRRLIIEEAAGITRYHSRKREAERKMASTRQNLLRVGDIIAEVKRQLNSLLVRPRKPNVPKVEK
jgi:chromosome segregation protein